MEYINLKIRKHLNVRTKSGKIANLKSHIAGGGEGCISKIYLKYCLPNTSIEGCYNIYQLHLITVSDIRLFSKPRIQVDSGNIKQYYIYAKLVFIVITKI